MDIDTLYTRRRAHLQRLIRERFGGNKTACARAVERNAPEIYRWLKPPDKTAGWARNMSEISARQIEDHLGLEVGYLDRPLHEERPLAEHTHEPDAVYLTPAINAVNTKTDNSFKTPSPCKPQHGVQASTPPLDEAECRHYALVADIADTLRKLSYEQVQTISKLIDVIRSQE